MSDRGLRQYVILPREGIRATSTTAFNSLLELPIAVSTGARQSVEFSLAQGESISVIDTVNEDGPRLVESSHSAFEAINSPDSPVRGLPIETYGIPDPSPQILSGTGPGILASQISLIIECREAGTSTPLPDCVVKAFSDFSNHVGVSGITDQNGIVTLQYGATFIERLYIYSPHTHWGAYRSNVTVASGTAIQIEIEPVDISVDDAVRHYYGSSQYDATTSVVVGVLDTGVGPHNDLNVVDGRNTVTGEPAGDYQDWNRHGTHVAGLIGSDSTPPAGLRGLAPGVALRAYRVFGNGKKATNYAIMKAMIHAASDGCDILNLSLGGGPYDQIIAESIQDARDHGMLVIIAAGNDSRKPVNYSAAYTDATAISAMGRDGTFPQGSVYDADILKPPNSTTNPREYIADFSNVGPQIAISVPGSGVLSTLPNNEHGPMSGTSMAAPVASGAAACLLSRDQMIFNMPKNRARSDAIEQLLQSNCTTRGFVSIYEGYGLPDPANV